MKITKIEKGPHGGKFGAYIITLTNEKKTIIRTFGKKWFPTLCKAIENGLTEKYVKPGAFIIKIGDDLPGTIAPSGYFKLDNIALKNWFHEQSKLQLLNDKTNI